MGLGITSYFCALEGAGAFELPLPAQGAALARAEERVERDRRGVRVGDLAPAALQSPLGWFHRDETRRNRTPFLLSM